MRVCINKSTNIIIEMQEYATEGTLAANAIGAGFTAEDIEEREVTAAEYAALLAAEPMTPDEYAAQARVALGKSDITVLRCAEQALLVPAGWVSYRVSLRAIIDGSQSGPLPDRPEYPA